MADALPSVASSPAPGAPVAAANKAGPSSPVPATPGAKVTAPLFGGLRGGRPRKDGLVPGSPEALAADREYARVRKEKQRERDKARDAATTEPTALPAAGGSVPGKAPAPANSGPGLADPVVSTPPPLPWDQATLRPLFEQLLPTVESLTINQVTGRAIKARLPRELVLEIERDARWTAPAKKAIELSAPQVAAKWLNKSGISAENQAEVVLGTAVASLLASHVMLLRRLDKLIAQQSEQSKPAAAEKPEEKKA